MSTPGMFGGKLYLGGFKESPLGQILDQERIAAEKQHHLAQDIKELRARIGSQQKCDPSSVYYNELKAKEDLMEAEYELQINDRWTERT